MSESVQSSAENGLTTITINRPDAMGALDIATKEGLAEALRNTTSDPFCRAILLTSASPKAFSVGQDLNEHVENLAGDDPLATVHEHYHPIARLLYETNKPVVAAVRGAAAGAGASLALLADFRVGGPKTSFTMAFAGIGLGADTAAGYTLPRLVGHAKATEMLLLNSTVRGPEATQIGLLTELADTDDDVLPRATALARQLADGPTVAYGQLKRQLRDFSADFYTTLNAEVNVQDACGHTEDHVAAVDAFVNKRQPHFEGR